ncbi:MAG: ABC transporter substrate-binding protein [Candidatus Levybacteria bacterium]|nr:ABC transporter substrate-binding protein [Candidatus Levybacteria bacterium]
MPRKKTKSTFFYFWVGFLGFISLCIIFYLSTLYGNTHAVDIGLIATKGTASWNAANLTVDQINASGGLLVNGTRFPVKLSIRENSVTEKETQQATQSLIDEGVLAIIGPTATNAAEVALSLATSQGILLLTPQCGSSCKNPFIMDAQNETFISGYKKTYGQLPDQSAGATYTALQQIFTAIEKNKSFDRSGILQSAQQ